ncbi:hypothetical protein [Candidatus Cyanaurora vandensis]|uniref:hypothetical protein n=1 Tax=Candidatus Cyanaurora vandensis TaxID=2714958 RepID=UPI00257C69BB|nr:hypothetical protein [Candidatus Cyanaurora vandensis]
MPVVTIFGHLIQQQAAHQQRQTNRQIILDAAPTLAGSAVGVSQGRLLIESPAGSRAPLALSTGQNSFAPGSPVLITSHPSSPAALGTARSN